MEVKIGDTIRIIEMKDEPCYAGKIGVAEFVDDIGQVHGTWGGCAIIPEVDKFEVVKKCCLCGHYFSGWGNNP